MTDSDNTWYNEEKIANSFNDYYINTSIVKYLIKGDTNQSEMNVLPIYVFEQEPQLSL